MIKLITRVKETGFIFDAEYIYTSSVFLEAEVVLVQCTSRPKKMEGDDRGGEKARRKEEGGN